MKFKIIFLLLSLFNFTLLTSGSIIETVYADPSLDGYIHFSQNAQAYSVMNWMYDMVAGDTWGVFPYYPDYNSNFRAYISFNLSEIPENYRIDSVYVSLFQCDSGGYNASTGDYTNFPVWDVAGGDTIKCILSHIDYGIELDVGDWEKGDVGNPYTFQNNIGIITENAIGGYHNVDVTSCVSLDYFLNRNRTQFRIAFQIDTDWDGWDDSVIFKTSNSQVEEHWPKLVLRYTDQLNSIEEQLPITKFKLSNYPNPFNPMTTIAFSIQNDSEIEISIFNIKGQKIKTLIKNGFTKGDHTIAWNSYNEFGDSVKSGVYFYTLRVNGKTEVVNKCLLLK